MENVVAVDMGQHVREALVKCGHDIGEGRGHQGIERADAHGAGELVLCGSKGARAGNGAYHVACVGDEILAVLSDGHVLSDPVKQLHAELPLQLLDLDGHGGLGIIQRLRCL